MFGPVSILVNNQRLYRTPLRKCGSDITIWPGSGMMRYYQTETLPAPIKVKLAMILAYSDKATVLDDVTLMLRPASIYTNNYPPEFEDIGWRASTSFFCVVLESKLLGEIRGDDTGEQGKKEGAGDSQ